ncbi:MAG: hypothetical protein KGI79_03570 [Patescibacteria group bacterium]|nr:hypothetical protein [Patescibacteria group bacterium]
MQETGSASSICSRDRKIIREDKTLWIDVFLSISFGFRLLKSETHAHDTVADTAIGFLI